MNTNVHKRNDEQEKLRPVPVNKMVKMRSTSPCDMLLTVAFCEAKRRLYADISRSGISIRRVANCDRKQLRSRIRDDGVVVCILSIVLSRFAHLSVDLSN